MNGGRDYAFTLLCCLFCFYLFIVSIALTVVLREARTGGEEEGGGGGRDGGGGVGNEYFMLSGVCVLLHPVMIARFP